ncbi:MAG: DUF5010 domain-containing protein [Armatimonadota bacterium]
MCKIRTLFLVLSLLAVCAISVNAADKVTCYTMWDDFYLYAAFEVADPDIISSNTTHMSKTWDDDSVEVFLETDVKRANNRSNNTYQMTASAGGGTNFLVGDNGVAKEKKIFSFKFAKKVIGTLNRPNDKDSGYIIEVAIPWKEIGGTPKAGQIMGFNFICRLKGENIGFVSFSPDVKTDQDINNPSKWAKIILTEVPSIVSMQDGAYVCRKVRIKAPMIDGILGPNEWIKNLSFQVTKPEPPPSLPRDIYVIENPILTHYFYWYQGDKRKTAPYSHITNPDGTDALNSHPLEGTGFWFSNDSVQWHKDQLTAIRNAGIDVIIPVYWGSTADKKVFASKGLSCMVQALKELKAEKKSYPLVGLFFDTSAMMVQYGSNPDLRIDEVKDTFYGMIKDFFLSVPDEFTASIQLPVEKGGYAANIITLYTCNFFSGIDNSFIEYCNTRFMTDFGRKLIWTGGSDFRSRGVTLDGYSSYGAGLGLQYDANGWIDMAGVGAGFDNSAVSGSPVFRARMNGDVYKKDWELLVSSNPNWMIVDGWNELHEGSDIAPSREYGDNYISSTRLNTLRFNGMRQYDAKYLKNDAPQTILPNSICLITLDVKNAGTKTWYPGQGIYIAGRWYKDGVLYSNAGARLPLQDKILPGQTLTKAVGIKSTDQEGKPLPEGNYELRIDMMQGNDEWFSASGDTPLCIPMKVTPNVRPSFTLVSSSAPTLMKSDAIYKVTLKLRNDGNSVWKAGSKIAYRWYKASVHLGQNSQDGTELLGSNESAAALLLDVEPGRIVEVVVPVETKSTDGKPLPVWIQDDPSTYMLKWDVSDGSSWLASSAIGTASEAVKITDTDFGPQFLASDAPNTMDAGKKYTVAVSVKNNGTDVWTKNNIKIGYHWYGIDGTEISQDLPKSSLAKDIKPGESFNANIAVIAPGYDGQYYLIWDLMAGDAWASASTNTKGNNILMQPVNVSKGKLVVLDIAKLLDEDVVSGYTNPGDGNVDGSGTTLPADLIPPFYSPIYDEKLWGCQDCVKNGIPALGRVSFTYPSKSDGAKNVMSCKEQKIAVKPGRYKAVNIVALASENIVGNITLTYKDKTIPAEVKFDSWTAAPANGGHPAFISPHRNSPNGIVAGRAYVNHYVIPSSKDSDLTSITLPNLPTVKVMAITLEKAD